MAGVTRSATSLTAALAPHVPLAVRSRADKYIRDRRTRNADWSDDNITYQVRGSQRYFVELARDPTAITVSCTCPYFEDRGPCKHVWAVAVLVDQDSRWDGSWLEGGPPIEFVTDDITLEEELEDELALGPGIGGPRGHWVPGFTPPAARARKPPKPIDPVTAAAQAAVNRLAELRHQLEATAAAAGLRAPRPIPPPGTELVFIIDAPATRAAGVLAVHAATRTMGTQADATMAGVKPPATNPLLLSPADVLRIARSPGTRARGRSACPWFPMPGRPFPLTHSPARSCAGPSGSPSTSR
jgi:hypothetical protein